MTGRHRGGRGLRRRLVVAVLAASIGRGYTGRHRLAAAALGRPAPVTADARPAAAQVAAAAPVPAAASPVPGAATAVTTVPAAPGRPARLSVVAVPAAPDPLTDTLPHPVVALFPLTPDERSADIDAVFADVDAQRETAATVELAAAEHPGYAGRHTA